ncbi:hypothetical protein AB0M28_06685 [Streptomyces sp. NPDC051940]|uniref:hypothetical protein n=1 Tax=Streptomyces sp. NPDC051940 TaxID=3155675 RepID=UPI0034321693
MPSTHADPATPPRARRALALARSLPAAVALTAAYTWHFASPAYAMGRQGLAALVAHAIARFLPV